MSDDSALQNIRNGLAKIDRLVTLLISSTGIGTIELATVLSATLINEPFGSPLHVSNLVSVCAVAFVYSRYPTIGTETILRFGWTTALVFAVLAMANGSLIPRTSGSLYYVVTSLLSWIAALAIGCVVVQTDDWRELLPG